MKAVVKVNKNSAYAQYNGHTFEVKEIMDKAVALSINDTITDFGHSEVILVDVQSMYNYSKNIAAAYDHFILGKNAEKTMLAIEAYCQLHKIRLYKQQ